MNKSASENTQMKSNASSGFLMLLRQMTRLLPASFWKLSLAVMLGLGSLATGLLSPLLGAEIINSLAAKQWPDFRYYLFILILLSVFQIALGFSLQWVYLIIDETLANSLRSRIVSAVLRKKYSFFERQWVGDIISRSVNDSAVLKPFLTSVVLQILIDALTLVVVTIILLRMHPVLGLLTISTAPITIFYGRKTQPSLIEATRLTREKIAALTGKLQSWLTRPFSLKIHSLEKVAFDQFSIENNGVTSSSVRLGLWGATLGAFNGILTALPSLLIFGYGGYITLSGSLSVGDLFAFITFSAYFTQPIQRLIQIAVVNLPALYAVYDRIKDFVEPDDEQGRDFGPSVKAQIEVESLRAVDLRFGFENENAYSLNVPSFTAHRGEITCITGANGSGKSTLARLLAGIYEPNKGTIKLLPENDQVSSDRRQWFAYMSQSPDLFDGTLRDNVTLYDQAPDLPSLHRIEKELGLEKWIASLEKGWDTPINGGLTSTMSGGQLQKIALARLLYSDCPILLLDEPSKNLDSETIDMLKELLNKAKENHIVVLITHSSEMSAICDRVYRLNPTEEGSRDYQCVEEPYRMGQSHYSSAFVQ